MKQPTKFFNRIIFIILLGLVLITCKKENQLIFNDDIETVKHAVEPTSGYTPGYFLDLIATIEGMVNDGLLNEDNGNALISKINSVIISIEKGN